MWAHFWEASLFLLLLLFNFHEMLFFSNLSAFLGLIFGAWYKSEKIFVLINKIFEDIQRKLFLFLSKNFLKNV